VTTEGWSAGSEASLWTTLRDRPNSVHHELRFRAELESPFHPHHTAYLDPFLSESEFISCTRKDY